MISLFKKKYSVEELNLFEFLTGVEQFEKLNYDELQQFLPIMHLRRYNQNEVVFFSGDPSQALYIVKKGEISLTIDVNDRFEELNTIKKGNAFGDNSLLANKKRIYNSTVLSEQADIYVIPHINMMEILDTHPEIKAKIMESVANMYNTYTADLFKIYKSSFGFFELSKVYKDKL